MIDAMEYRDYGYHYDVKERLMENIKGSAFMIYKNERWNIRYQSFANAPGISSLKEESVGLFQKRPQLKGAICYSEGGGVVKNKVIPLHF